MRKPLVVVCAAASALLLAGGVAATSAGAEEAPDVPGFAGLMPDWVGLPFGGGTGDGRDVTGADDAGSAGAGDPDGGADPIRTDPFPDPGVGSPRPAPADRRDDTGDRPRPAGADDRAAGEPAADEPAADVPARPRPARVQQQSDETDDRQRRADVGARPGGAGQQLGFSAQGGGNNLLAGARRGVTAADISTSPSAPLQQQVLALVNQNRRRGGCDPLQLDRRLIEAATEHASDMARRRYFAHESPDGDGAGERVSEAGYRWKRYSENIARGADSPWEVVDGWMNSRVHRENILDCRLHEMGLGLAIAGDRTPYWVQDFATPAE